MSDDKKMLILRGNSGDYPDECGNSPAKPPYEAGSDVNDHHPDDDNETD